MDFHVDQIDHVELLVPNRRAAAQWYRDVLGLEVVAEYEHWAEDPRGPLMVATLQGNTKLALFEGVPEGSRKGIGFHRVAFRVGSSSFMQFVTRLSELELKDDRGHTVTQESVTDHSSAYSIYFCDPYGNYLEITTYEYDETTEELKTERRYRMSKRSVFKSVFPYQTNVLALPVNDLAAASEWYCRHFGMTEVERRDRPSPTVILERDGTRIGFSINGGDASQDGAAILVSSIHRLKDEFESKGVEIGNWRVDERDGQSLQVFFVVAPDGLCYYFHEPIDVV